MFYSEIYQPGVADFDRGGKLGYEAILRIFENTASRHSDSSGDDIIAESRHGITWVLTDWRVQIVRRPDSKAPLRVTTWVRDSVPTGRVFRDYTLADETGTELVVWPENVNSGEAARCVRRGENAAPAPQRH